MMDHDRSQARRDGLRFRNVTMFSAAILGAVLGAVLMQASLASAQTLTQREMARAAYK